MDRLRSPTSFQFLVSQTYQIRKCFRIDLGQGYMSSEVENFKIVIKNGTLKFRGVVNYSVLHASVSQVSIRKVKTGQILSAKVEARQVCAPKINLNIEPSSCREAFKITPFGC